MSWTALTLRKVAKARPMIVATARDAAELLEPYLAAAPRERLIILHLDSKRRLIEVDEHDVASEETVLLPTREIFASALGLGASGLVIGHNHPSGNPEPSHADIEATRRLAAAGAELRISLHDHLIFAAGEWRSFRELGLI